METRTIGEKKHYYTFGGKVPVSVRLTEKESSHSPKSEYGLSVSHDVAGSMCSGVSVVGIDEDTFHSLKILLDYWDK